MDPIEMRVLRRKSFSFQNQVSVDDSFFDLFIQEGFITRSEKSVVMGERDNLSKTIKMFDIMQSTNTITFDQFINLLELSGNEEMAEEIKLEMAFELGSVEIEPTIHNEAEMLISEWVYKDKILTEKGIEGLIKSVASKIQITKQVHQKSAERRNELINDEIRQINDNILKVRNQIKHLKEGDQDANDHKNKIESLKDVDEQKPTEFSDINFAKKFVNRPDDPSLLEKLSFKQVLANHLSDAIGDLFNDMNNIIVKLKEIKEEQKICFKLLSYSSGTESLDKVLENNIKVLMEEFNTSNQKIFRHSINVTSLKKFIKTYQYGMEKQLSYKDNQLIYSNQLVSSLTHETENTKSKLFNYENNIGDMKNERDYWLKKSRDDEFKSNQNYMALSNRWNNLTKYKAKNSWAALVRRTTTESIPESTKNVPKSINRHSKKCICTTCLVKRTTPSV